jgi:hypothetical protein
MGEGREADDEGIIITDDGQETPHSEVLSRSPRSGKAVEGLPDIPALPSDERRWMESPRSLAEAQKSPLWSWWLRAMQVEKEQLEILKTWELVSPPQNARILPGKWVFKLKLDADGAPLRLKARWVARGFQQQEGLDYHGQV